MSFAKTYIQACKKQQACINKPESHDSQDTSSYKVVSHCNDIVDALNGNLKEPILLLVKTEYQEILGEIIYLYSHNHDIFNITRQKTLYIML